MQLPVLPMEDIMKVRDHSDLFKQKDYQEQFEQEGIRKLLARGESEGSFRVD